MRTKVLTGGEAILSQSANGTFHVWSAAELDTIFSFESGSSSADVFAVAPDSSLAAVAQADALQFVFTFFGY